MGKDLDGSNAAGMPLITDKEGELATTIDPTYVIRLIRELLPDSVRRKNGLQSKEPDLDSVPPENGKNEHGSSFGEQQDDKVGHKICDNHGDDQEAEAIARKLQEKRNLQRQIETLERIEMDREEAGCVLWDLAASQAHAKFLVENHVLEVLLLTLQCSESSIANRIREVSLGILGNLACHELSQKAFTNVEDLIPTIVKQLFVDDPPSITETCRILCAGLHSLQYAAWIAQVDSEEVLSRVLWVAGNTLHESLLHRVLELILAMVDGRQDPAQPSVLATLLKLQLPLLLSDIMDTQIKLILGGESDQNDNILDTALQIAEAMSLSDQCAVQMAGNDRFFSLACKVVESSTLSDEIGPSAVTALVLVANLMAEDVSLVTKVVKEHAVCMLDSLLSLLPELSEDSGARNALWSILGRSTACLLLQLEQRDQEPAQESLQQEQQQPQLQGGDNSSKELEQEVGAVLAGVTAVLAGSSGRLVRDLEEHREEDTAEDAAQDMACSSSRGWAAKLNIVGSVVALMERWARTREKANGHRSQLLAAVETARKQLGELLLVEKGEKEKRQTAENRSSEQTEEKTGEHKRSKVCQEP